MSTKWTKEDADALISAVEANADAFNGTNPAVDALLDLRAALDEEGGGMNVMWAQGRIERALQQCAPSKAKAKS